MRLKDKVTLVTGAASGIGREIALLFAMEGSSIIVADLNKEGGGETVKMIKKNNGQAAFVQVDVTNSAQVEAMVKFAVNTFGRINILVNNAGVWWPAKDRLITEMAEADWDKIIAVDLKSVFLCSKFAIPELIKAGGGVVVNMSSVAGLIVSERPAYSAAKGGIIALTRSMAAQFANSKIRVNAICPGSIDTPLIAAGHKDFVLSPPQFPLPDALLKRIGKPEEVAKLALFLASDDSSFCTGGVYVIDGGITAR